MTQFLGRNRMTCRCLHGHCIHVSDWFYLVWTGSTNLHYRVWDALVSLHTFDTNRSSRCPRVAHYKILSDRFVFVTCHIIEDKNEIWKRFIWWNSIAVIKKCKITDFFNRCQISKYRYFDCCNDFEYARSRSHDFSINLSTRFLPQFDGPQMTPRIEIGSMLAYFFSVCILLSILFWLFAIVT